MILKLEHIGQIDTGTFNLSQGITTILGANGSGKSTLVNALFMALTGEPIDSCTLDEKVTHGYDTGTITLNTGNWRVTRTIGKKSSVLLEDKSGTRLTKKAEVNDYILKWYNLPSTDIIKEVYFSAQFRATDAIETTPAVRLAMLASVLGFAKYEKGQKYLYQYLSQMPEINYSETTYTNLLNQKEEHEISIRTFKERIAKNNEELNALPSEEQINAILESPTFEEFKKNEQEKADLESKLKETEKELQNAYDEKSNIGSLRNLIDKWDHYYQDKEELEELIVKMKDIETRMPHAAEKIKECINEDTLNKMQLEQDLKAIEERKNLLQGGVCPLSKDTPCSRLIAMSDPTKLDNEANLIKKNINILNENIETMQAMLKGSEDAYKEYVANDAKQAVLKARLLQKPSEEIEITEEQKKKVADYSELKSNTKIAGLVTDIDLLRKGISIKEAIFAGKTPVTAEDKKKASEQCLKRADIMNKLLVDSTYVTSTQKAYEDICELIETMEKEKQKAEEHNFKRNVYMHTRHLLSKDCLPRLLMENTIKQLNTHLLYYINLFNFPYKCQVFADGNFMYSDDQDTWYNTKLLSGGQKYMVSIMLKLALAATLKTNFPFYVLDEPTTGLDVENRRLLADLFRDMEAKINPLYLIIPTHDVEIADSASNTITIGG